MGSSKPTQLPYDIDRTPEYSMTKGQPDEVGQVPEEPNNLVYLLKSTNYKVEGSFAHHSNVAKKTHMVVDTGVGPNCVLCEALPMEARLKIHKGENYHLRTANDEMIPTVGELQLIIRLRDYVALARFVVCKILPCHLLLGTEFQGTQLEIRDHKVQFFEFPNGQRLPTVRNGKDFINETKSITIGGPGSSHGYRRKDCKVRVAKRTMISPKEQKFVSVVSSAEGTVIVEPEQ